MANTCLSTNSQLALDTIQQQSCLGIPTWLLNPMEWSVIDRLAELPPGSYEKDPVPVYNRMLRNAGCCMVDQWIPKNPLSMGVAGYGSDTPRSAATGAKEIVLDGMLIDSPEAAIEHMERHLIPSIKTAVSEFDAKAHAAAIVSKEHQAQEQLGADMLKVPYGHANFPHLRYNLYGYENYFMAYIEYPEVIEADFAAQADLSCLRNAALVQAMQEHDLPPLLRLDHDMADSRGTIVSIDSLDTYWFPHFTRSIEPIRQSDIAMIWHCDGNLSAMLPRLLDVGLHGFQGFQYEDGMDYQKICAMRCTNGNTPIIIAGVSVSTTLPQGSPDDVRREMKFLVEHGPATGLFLGASSSITPGVPWENIQALVEGLQHYREHGRGS